jgi:hypothetical protein
MHKILRIGGGHRRGLRLPLAAPLRAIDKAGDHGHLPLVAKGGGKGFGMTNAMEDDAAGDAAATGAEATARAKRPQQVYTLVVEVGRKAGDGLPAKATGAGLLIYASGVDEAEAVRETVAILKEADLAPLEVTGHGTLEERLKAGDEIDPEEQALMARALAENSVIVAEMTPFFD